MHTIVFAWAHASLSNNQCMDDHYMISTEATKAQVSKGGLLVAAHIIAAWLLSYLIGKDDISEVTF